MNRCTYAYIYIYICTCICTVFLGMYRGIMEFHVPTPRASDVVLSNLDMTPGNPSFMLHIPLSKHFTGRTTNQNTKP